MRWLLTGLFGPPDMTPKESRWLLAQIVSTLTAALVAAPFYLTWAWIKDKLGRSRKTET